MPQINEFLQRTRVWVITYFLFIKPLMNMKNPVATNSNDIDFANIARKEENNIKLRTNMITPINIRTMPDIQGCFMKNGCVLYLFFEAGIHCQLQCSFK